MKGRINMNNRNWIAVFLGLACLVLFVSVMGASNNWLTGNNTGNTNNGATPQQINQTVRNMDSNTAPPDGTMQTEIDANKMTDTIKDTMKNDNTENTQTAENTNNNQQSMPKLAMPKITQ